MSSDLKFKWFDDSPDVGDPACICSRCGEPILDGVPIRLFDTENNLEARFHFECSGPVVTNLSSVQFHRDVIEELVEFGPEGEWPVFYHDDFCPGYCDYACGGVWHEDQKSLECDASARLHRKEAGVFVTRCAIRGTEAEWHVEKGAKSLGVSLEDGEWYVRFPAKGGSPVYFDYEHVCINDDMFERVAP